MVRSILNEHARSSQSGVRAQLEASLPSGDVSSYQAFHIVNVLAMDGGLATIVDLARRYDVERIVANYPLISLWNGTHTSSSWSSKTDPLATKGRYGASKKWPFTFSGEKMWGRSLPGENIMLSPDHQFDASSLN